MVLGRCANRFKLGLSGDCIMRHGRDLDSLDRWIDEKEYRNRNIESQQQRFTCWHCGSELVWGGDHDLEQEDYDIVSNFSCMNCKTYVEVYHKCQ